MSDQAIAIMSLAVAVFAAAVLYFFKSPKEINGELAKRLDDVKEDHELLARRFERHDEVVKNLIQALDRLTGRIDRIEPHLTRAQNARRGD